MIKRSKSENDTKDVVHHNISIYRRISEKMNEMNRLMSDIEYIDIELKDISNELLHKKDHELQSDLVSLLLERDLIKEMMTCINTQIDYNISIL